MANKTKIDYNGLDIGTLTSIKLAEDHKHVIATAAMNPKTKEFLVKDTKFWVVKPRMSGLEHHRAGHFDFGKLTSACRSANRRKANVISPRSNRRR